MKLIKNTLIKAKFPHRPTLFMQISKNELEKLITFKKGNIMGKGQDAKKNVKKEAGKTAKEKKAAKREKKAKKGQFFL